MDKQTHINHNSHEQETAAWIVGRDAYSGTDYIIHTVAPAFLAKLGHDTDDGVLSGLSYSTSDDRSIFDFMWFDAALEEIAFIALMREAEEAIAAHRARADF